VQIRPRGGLLGKYVKYNTFDFLFKNTDEILQKNNILGSKGGVVRIK